MLCFVNFHFFNNLADLESDSGESDTKDEELEEGEIETDEDKKV